MVTKKLLPLTLLCILMGCSSEQAELTEVSIRPVKLFEVSDFNEAMIQKFPAKTAATKEVDLSFRIQGHLIDFDLVEGVKVKKGQILAQLDDRDAQNNMLNLEADFDLATLDFKRKKDLLNQKLISQADYDLAIAKIKSARAAYSSSIDQVSYTMLRAPYDGTIAKIDINNYQVVQANQVILTLQKDSYIDVVIQVPETLTNKVTQQSINQSVSARFLSQPSISYPLQLKEFATQVTPGTQSYEVVFTMPQPKTERILPGMSAEVLISLDISEKMKQSTVLPIASVSKRDSDGQSVVWVYDEEKSTVQAKPVIIGNVVTEGITIIKGLSEGDKVVSAGIQYLTDGMLVKPIHWQRGV